MNTFRPCLMPAAALWGVAALALALSACQGDAPAPLAALSVPPADTDPAFMRAMLLEDVSTRDAPKPKARFVLSENTDSSSKYHSGYRTSVVIDTLSGCSLTLEYETRMGPSSIGPSRELPGAPGGAKGELLSATEPKFSLSAKGGDCAALPMRQDLARARELARGANGGIAVSRAFAEALPEARAAVDRGGSPEPGSRFALIATTAGKGGEAVHTLLERSTGCQWSVAEGASAPGKPGPLAPKGVSPDSCVSALVAAYGPAALPRPGASASPGASEASR